MAKQIRKPAATGEPNPAEALQPERTDPASAPRDVFLFQAEFSSLLPPPALLRQYNEVAPGTAERLLSLVEAQTSHRLELEKSLIAYDIRRAYLGLGAAFFVALTSIVSGSLVAVNGQPWAGTAVATATVIGLVYAFLKGIGGRRDEREAKLQQLDSARPPLTPP